MKIALLTYRIVYGGFLALLLYVLTGDAQRTDWGLSQIVPFWLAAGAAAFLLVVTWDFYKMAAWIHWIAALVFCGFLTWWGWYSYDSIFRLHETHSFDPVKVAIEESRFRTRAEIEYAFLLVWLISLAVVRQLSAKAEPGSGNSK
jgi:hypothetical protein